MKAAIEAVTSNNMSISAASREFKVPRKTLDDRIGGKVALGKKLGHTTILTSAEEESLIQYLLYMGERGYPLEKNSSTCLPLLFIADFVRVAERSQPQETSRQRSD